jgi:O-antigen ligase
MAYAKTAADLELPYTAVQFVPLAALAVVVLDSATDFFPDEPLAGVVTPVRLAILAGLAALLVAGGRLREFRTRLDLPIALLLFASVATTYLGGHPTAPLRGLVTAVAGYYLVVGVRRAQPESWRAVALLALVSVSAAGTTAFAQLTNEVPTGFCRTGLLTDVDCEAGAAGTLIRATGTFANPNLLAAFLVLVTPIALLSAAALADRTAKVAVAVVGLVGLGAVLTTFSRAGYVAAAAGMVVFGVAHWLAPRLGRRQRRAMTVVGLAGLAAAAVAIWVVSGAGKSLGVRGQAWQAAVDLGTANPLGVGLGRAGAVISAAVPGERVFVHAHNLWLNWLVEAGVLGLLAMVTVTVVAWFSASRASRERAVTGPAGLAALTGFFLMCTMDNPANLVRIEALFWIVLGLVMAEVPGSWRRSRAEQRPTGGRRRASHRRKVGSPRDRRSAAEPYPYPVRT